jgi:hypothetical protein
LSFKHSANSIEPLVNYCPDGIVETTLSQADYEKYATCSLSSYFLAEPVPADIKE